MFSIVPESGRAQLSKSLRLCSPLKSVSDGEGVKAWLNGAWGNLAMVDYPYPASFLEPLPGWPIKVMHKETTTKEME